MGLKHIRCGVVLCGVWCLWLFETCCVVCGVVLAVIPDVVSVVWCGVVLCDVVWCVMLLVIRDVVCGMVWCV